MDAQTVITGVLVAGCSAWVVRMLLPAGARARVCTRLGIEAPAPSSAGACGGCRGCGGSTPPVGTPQGVKIVRGPRA